MRLLLFTCFFVFTKILAETNEESRNEKCQNVKEFEDDLPCTKDGNKYTKEVNVKQSSPKLTEKQLLFQQQIEPIAPSEFLKKFGLKREEKKVNSVPIIEKDNAAADHTSLYIRLPVIDGVKVGYEKILELFPGEKRKMKTLSLHPPIFEIEEFFDEDECDLLIEYAKRKRLKSKETSSGGMLIRGSPQKTFEVWDLNDDGYVDHEEMMLLPGKTDVKLTLEDAGDMIFLLKMDKDGDGKIDLSEFENTDLSEVKKYFDQLKQDPPRARNMTAEAAWIWHDTDEILRFQDEYFYAYHDRFASATGLPKEIIEESEPLKVQKFSKGQFQTCGQDSEPTSAEVPCCLYGESSKCRLCRYASVSIFLNQVDEGGELVFPLADNNFSRNLNNSGEWRGYFQYAKTSGSKNHFEIDLVFKKNGSNLIAEGLGKDDSGQFEIKSSILIDETITFEKSYLYQRNNGMTIKYAGKMLSGAMIVGNWWIPEKKRFHGTFFMWLKQYEIFTKTSTAKCNQEQLCDKIGLIVKPRKGTAIVWYNHRLSTKTGMIGDLEQETTYGHCPVEQNEQWIAKAWINVIGDGKEELRAWRRGKNWLSARNKSLNILKTLGTTTKPLVAEYYEEEHNKGTNENTDSDTVSGKEGSKARRKGQHILNAINSILEVISKDELKAISKVVNKKLSITCVR